QTIRHNAYDQDPYAKEFGIKSEKLASVEARILPAPWLKYHGSGEEKSCLPQEFNPEPVIPIYTMLNSMFTRWEVENTVLVDAASCRTPLVSDIPTIIFGADVTHPENGENSTFLEGNWTETTDYILPECNPSYARIFLNGRFS
ncbi:hypothetical protein S245_027830, partial [Arachis hypogaea]